jgi:hypothetical protein
MVAAVALLCAAAWLFLNVAFQYSGNPSGLFFSGAKAELPAELATGHTYRVNDNVGYDGAFYHLIAHDPLNRRGFLHFVDNPRLRWRRIAVPALAAFVALGNDHWVDHAYIAIQLLFVYLGALWLGRFAQSRGLHAVWGLAFLLIPAVAVSLDRMTVDLPLAALSIGLALHADSPKPKWPCYAMLCAAPLVRETGMVLVAAWCLYSAVRRDGRGVALGAASAAPSLAWWTYVQRHTPADSNLYLSAYPFSGIIQRTLSGAGDPTTTLWLRAANTLEKVALTGMWLALVLALSLLFWRVRKHAGFIELAAVLFLGFAAMLGRFELWASAYATGRTMSPLLIMLGLLALERRSAVFAAPLLLVVPRIALQYEAQLKGVLRGML